MHASKPSSSTTQLHFSFVPAMPTTRQPTIFAIWPAIEPTPPAAPDTTNVSPAFGWPMSSTPKYAVTPVLPNRLNESTSSMPSGSGLAITPVAPPITAYSCQPSMPITPVPTGSAGFFDATTCPAPPLRITSPI